MTEDPYHREWIEARFDAVEGTIARIDKSIDKQDAANIETLERIERGFTVQLVAIDRAATELRDRVARFEASRVGAERSRASLVGGAGLLTAIAVGALAFLK